MEPQTEAPQNTETQHTESGGSPPESLLTADEITELHEHELAIQGQDFIQGWMYYGMSRTDAPPKFHEMIAFGLVAVAIDRSRHLPLRHKDVYPSVFGIAIAPSGKRKSTPFGYGEAVALSAFPDRVLGNDYSPEALLSDLATEIDTGDGPARLRDASRGAVFVDEAGRLLTTMRRSGYGEGLKDVLSMIWDAPEKRSRKLQKGEYTLESVYVNLLMATTDTRFAETMTPEDITSGFLARFLPMMAMEEIKRRDIDRRTADVDAMEQNLVAALKGMKAKLTQSPGPMAITDEALKLMNRAERALETWANGQYHVDLIAPWARRLAEYSGRLGIIFAVSEGRDEVDRLQVLRAVQVIDRAKEDVLMLVDEMTKSGTAHELDRIERFIRVNPGITGRDLQRRTHKTAGQLKPVLEELHNQGRVVLRGKKKLYAVVGAVTVSPVTSVTSEVSPLMEVPLPEPVGDGCDSATGDTSPSRTATQGTTPGLMPDGDTGGGLLGDWASEPIDLVAVERTLGRSLR